MDAPCVGHAADRLVREVLDDRHGSDRGARRRRRRLYRLVRERSSCHGFLPDPVERSIVETVYHSPSCCNTQPWHLTITQGEGTEAFRRALDAHVRSGAAPEPDFAFPERYEGEADGRRKECARLL